MVSDSVSYGIEAIRRFSSEKLKPQLNEKQAVLSQTLFSNWHNEKIKQRKKTLKVSDRAELYFISCDVKSVILRYVPIMYAASDGKAEKS